MGYFVVEPEASGRPAGEEGAPSCIFDTWLGDDVVSAHPLLLVTTRLKDALLGLSQPTGFSLVPARATRSAFFERYNPDRSLPTFWAVQVEGRPAVDDLGMSSGGRVVASARVVEVLARFSLKHATLSQYAASGAAAGSEQELAPSGGVG
ncbi:MAG TPA: hypothetical protein VI669_15435 [Vicinamibacteria bacterium]